MKYGDNFLAVFICNAIEEMRNFLNAVHGLERDVKGYSVKIAQLEMEMIAEGYYGTKCIREINEKYKVNMPILDTLYSILYEKKSPTTAIRQLTETFK